MPIKTNRIKKLNLTISRVKLKNVLSRPLSR